MIKLLWNTHNQPRPTLHDPGNKKARDHMWGIYHKKNSDKWIFEILSNVDYKIIGNQNDLKNNDTLIIVDSSIENKSELYTKLSLICPNIYLIHLGDETGMFDLSQIYSIFKFVWRTFCSNKYFNSETVQCLPIGYKSGTTLINNPEKRKYKWAFIGTPHKSSRHDLLFQLSEIASSFSHKTKKFNKSIIEVDEMSKILSSTEFIPCPNGFVHPETYRLYEALECGCIPIVENAYKYYDRLFPNNPFFKVDKWIDAKSIINKLKNSEIKKKSEECFIWWKNYKEKLKESINKRICL
tara:strand:+ start:4324 stop:5211 length:888 start_codon:yes stop_codon:yes gene_type:complete